MNDQNLSGAAPQTSEEQKEWTTGHVADWIEYKTAGYIAEAHNQSLSSLRVEIERLKETERKYYELIYAVQNKYLGESRHSTALRFINERSSPSALSALASKE